jgi:hypothetical protein
VFTSNLDDPNLKKKTLWLGRFLFLAFINMAASNLTILLAALLPLTDRLDEVRRRAIFCTPSSSFLEASRVRMRPASSLFTPSLLTNVKNVV